MKREEYYNKEVFFACNDEVKEKLNKFCEDKNIPQYVVITKALKDFLKIKEVTISEKILLESMK